MSPVKDIADLENTLAQNPHDRKAFESLEDTYIQGQKWEELVALYRAQTVLVDEIPEFWERGIAHLDALATQLEELPERAEILIQVGIIWEDKLERRDQALAHYQKAFKVWPYKTEALARSRPIYAQHGNWPLVLRLFKLELQVAQEPQLQADIYTQMARIHAEELGEKEKAVELLGMALEVHPSDKAAATLLSDLTTDKPSWEGELGALDRELETAEKGRASSGIHLQRAQVLMEHSPGDAGIEAALQAAVSDDPRSDEAHVALCGFYRSQERWPELAEALAARANGLRKDEARATLLELATIQRDRLDDQEAAVKTFESVLQLDPEHPAAVKYAARAYEATENWEGLVDLYKNALKRKRRTPEELDLLLQLGDLTWHKMEDLAGAERHYRRVRLADPKRPEMLRFYQHFFKAEGNWKKYYNTLSTLRGVVQDDEEQLSLSIEMARVARDEMKSPEKAIDVWKSVLKVDGGNQLARQSLLELYLEAGKWNALLEHYKSEIALLGDPITDEERSAVVDLHLKMVEIYRDQLRLDVMVIQTYNAILGVDPANTVAIDALSERFEAARRWNDLISVLQRKVDASPEPEAAVPLLHRIAELWQSQLGNHSQAIPVLERVLELDPQDETALAKLDALYTKRRNWSSLLGVRDKQAARLEGEVLAEHLAEMADVARQRLGDLDQARELGERVCSSLDASGEVSNRALYTKTLRGLERLYQDQGDDAALVRVLERRLTVADDPKEQIQILEPLSNLVATSLEDPERATGLWTRILELSPSNESALSQLTEYYVRERRWDALEALFGGRGDHERLFEILDTGASMLESEDERVDLFRRMGRIAEQNLDDADRVMLSLESILELQPTHVGVASELLPYYRNAGESQKEINANTILLENDGGDTFELTCEICRLYEEALDDKASAFEWADKAFRMRPSDAALRAQIESLARSAERLAELVATYKQVASGIDDAEVQLDLHRTIARTTHLDLEWQDDAVTYFENVLDVASDDSEAVDALNSLYRTLERWEDLLTVLRRKVDLSAAAGNFDEVVELRFQEAELLQGPLGRASEAIDCYRNILDIKDDSLDAVRGLKFLHESDENWTGVVDAMARELELVESDQDVDAAASLRLQLGNIHQHRLDDRDEAVRWYATLLDRGTAGREPAVSALEGLLDEDGAEMGRRVRIAELLEPVHRTEDHAGRLAEMLEIRLEAMDSDEQRAATLWELAGLYETRVEDLDRAFGTQHRLLALTPGDAKVWDEIDRLAGTLGRWSETETWYADLVPGAGDTAADAWRFDLLRRLARIQEQELTRDEAARSSYEILLARDPADRLTIDSLDAVYGRLGAHADLVRLLRSKADLAEDAQERRAIDFRIAGIQEVELEDGPAAVDTLRGVLVADPTDAEASAELERLFTDSGHWSDLVDLLTSRSDLDQPEASRLDIQFQLGGVLLTRLGDTGGAIETYRGILEAQPDHAALGAMEDLSADLVASGADVELRRRVDATLEPIYVGAENWEKLAGVLELQLAYTDDRDDRVALETRLGRLRRDRLEQPELAFEHLRNAITLRFDDADLRGEFEALAAATDRWQEVIDLYESCLSNLEDDDATLRRSVLERLAQLHESERADVARAIDAHRRILYLDGDDRQALSSLERLFEQEQEWGELVQICARQAELESGEARVAILRKVGGLYTGPLGAPDEAVATYSRILDIDPVDGGALDALEGLYEASESWSELIRILETKVQASTDSQVRRGLNMRIAALHETELGDVTSAVAAYSSVLDAEPEDADALNELDRLYGETEQWPELAGILDRKAAQAEGETDTWTTLRFRLGQVQQHQLFDVLTGVATYEAILARDPGHADSREALRGLLTEADYRFAASKVLEPLYRSEDKLHELVEVLELQLLDTVEDERRLALLDDLCEIHEAGLDDASAAHNAVRRAYLIDPSVPLRINRMDGLAAETGEWSELVMAYEEALVALADGDAILETHLKVARIYRDELGEVQSAENSFRNALDQDPDCLEALSSLERILEEQSRWDDLLEILEQVFAVRQRAEAHDEAKAALFKIARIRDDVQGDASGAIATHLRVLDLEEANAEAIHALKDLYRREERWSDLTGMLGQEISYAVDDAQVVMLRSELAAVHRDHLEDPRRAVEVYQSILDVAGDHPATVGSLESLFSEGTEDLAVASILQPIYRRAEDWAKLCDVLEVLLRESEDDAEREQYLIQIARIHQDKLSQPELALATWARLLRHRPGLTGVWGQLEHLAGELNAWQQVAEYYGEELQTNLEISDDVRLPLALRHARILDERLDSIEPASVVYREVLLLDERNAEATDALDRIYTRMEAWDDLVDLYRRSADLAEDDAARLNLLFRVATIYHEIARDPVSAIDAYRAVLDLDEAQEGASKGLERLYEQEEQWAELADLYRGQASRVEGNARLSVQHRLASVLHTRLDEVAEAVGLYQSILDASPKYGPARRALEELLRSAGEPELRLQIAVLLRPLYDPVEEWDKLVHVREVQLECVQDRHERVECLVAIAELREHRQGAKDEAFEAYANAFREDPENADLEANLERLAASQEFWGPLAELYLEAPISCDSPARVAALLHRAATILLEQGESDRAIDTLRDVLDRDEADRKAITRLEDLYAQSSRYRDLVEVLYKKADLDDDVLHRKETYYRIAELWEHSLEDDQMAIDTYRAILDIDDEDLAAIEALERLYRRASLWENLVGIYQVKVDLVDSTGEKVAVHRAVADIYETELMEADEAITTFRTIRDLDATDMDAVRSLNRLYTQQERWVDLLDVLDVERSLVSEPAELDSLEFQMGRLLEDHLYDSIRAIDLYRQIVERNPENEQAVGALERLLTEPDYRARAAKVLEPHYERQCNWESLIDALELELQDTDDSDMRRGVLERVAAIQETSLQNPAMAFITYGRAVRQQPEYVGAREQLERLAESQSSWDELVAIYEEALDEIYDHDLVSRLNLRLGQIYDGHLDDTESAIGRYERVLELDEHQPEALDALDRLFQKAQRWDRLTDVLERKLHVSEGATRRELRYRLAYILEVIFSDVDQALGHYRTILEGDASHANAKEALERLLQHESHRAEVVEVLEPLYAEAGEWDRLVTALQLRREIMDDPFDASELAVRTAVLQEEKQGDQLGAFMSYCDALRSSPGDDAAAGHVERLAETCDTWADACALFDELAENSDDDIDAREMTLKVAGWYKTRLRDLQTAEERYRRVLEADPENNETIDALVGIYTEQRRYSSLYEVYDHKAGVVFDVSQRKKIYTRMARIAIEQLAEPERAVEAYEKLRAADDTDVDALEALEGLYGESGRWEDSAEALERRSDLVDDPTERVALRMRLAEVAHLQLDDMHRAIDAYRYAVDIDAGNLEALSALAELLEAAEDWAGLQETLGQWLQFAPDDATRVRLHLRSAANSEERFEDADGAVGSLSQALLVEPGNADALAALERLYRKSERWYDLMEVYESQLEAATDEDDQVRLHVAISDVAAERLGDIATAKDHLQKVLDADANHVGALAVLGKLYQADAEWEKAIEIVERQIAHAAEPEMLSDLYLQRGRMLLTHFGDAETAERSYLKAVEALPTNRDAIVALKEFYREREDWTHVLTMSQIEIQQIDEGSERVAALLEMADLARDQLKDDGKAVEALQQAYQASGQELDVAERLLGAYVDAGRWDEAEPILDGIIDDLESRRKLKQVFKFHHLRGKIADSRGDQLQALESYQRCHELDATFIPNLIALGMTYIGLESWQQALKIYQTLLLHQMKIKDKDQKRDVYYNLGCVRMKLEEFRRAKDMFNRALGIDRGHQPSKDRLAELP